MQAFRKKNRCNVAGAWLILYLDEETPRTDEAVEVINVSVSVY